MSTIVPTKTYERLVREEMDRRKPEHGTWYSDWGEYTPENRARVARNVLTAQKIFEYPTRGWRDDLREYVALRIAPWLVRQPGS